MQSHSHAVHWLPGACSRSPEDVPAGTQSQEHTSQQSQGHTVTQHIVYQALVTAAQGPALQSCSILAVPQCTRSHASTQRTSSHWVTYVVNCGKAALCSLRGLQFLVCCYRAGLLAQSYTLTAVQGPQSHRGHQQVICAMCICTASHGTNLMSHFHVKSRGTALKGGQDATHPRRYPIGLK